MGACPAIYLSCYLLQQEYCAFDQQKNILYSYYMTTPRSQQVSVADTPYYHVVSRCVRRAFLCGTDRKTGENYEHRRDWIEGRIRILSSLFAIDICAYAVMSNHYHAVVHLNPCEAEAWSDDEVLHRWCSLYKGMPLVQKYLDGKPLLTVELEAVNSCIAAYRRRLQDLSWFMKCLNEPIARQANKEDGYTGHFWEARFKSQALFTEDALLSAMAYVDLNPIRACMADTPENSDFTSIKERIELQFDLAAAISQQTDSESLRYFDLQLKPLAKFDGNLKLENQTSIIFRAADYLLLVDITGRMPRSDKRGAIKASLPPILERLNLDIDAWLIRTQGFERHYHQLFSKYAARSKAA